MEKMLVYKGTDKDMKCRGFRYEVGKDYKVDPDTVVCCKSGFHTCEAPMDVLRYYGLKNGNRFFKAKASGKIGKDPNGNDSKVCSSEIRLTGEIDIKGLIAAQIEYVRKKAKSGKECGNWSNLAGGDRSNLAGGNKSNLAGGEWSNLAGGNWSNLAGGNWSHLAGGDRSNLAGGNNSNLAGGEWSNLAGGNESNLAGGDRSLLVARNGCKAKAGKNSVIVLTEWGDKGNPVAVKAEIVDGERIKADTWYQLKDGEFVEVQDAT